MEVYRQISCRLIVQLIKAILSVRLISEFLNTQKKLAVFFASFNNTFSYYMK